MERVSEIAQAFLIPCVAERGRIGQITEFLSYVKELKGLEGFVVRFDNGHMLKVKADEYCVMHRTKEGLSNEKDVWGLVLEDRMDDALANMDAADRDRCERFTAAFNRQIEKVAADIATDVEEARESTADDKKAFATDWLKTFCEDGGDRACVPLMFAVWDGKDPIEVVKGHLRKNCSTITKVNAVRALVGGLTWDDYRDRRAVD